ncbi:putative Heterokaryon incompatibility domain-containing protein [Seiridium cardinale]
MKCHLPDGLRTGMLPTMKRTLCHVCEKLNIGDITNQRGFALHTTLLDLHRCVAKCVLCRGAVSQICRENAKFQNSFENESYLASQQVRVCFRQHVHAKHGLTLTVTDIYTEAPGKGDTQCGWLMMRVLEGDPARRYGAATARLIYGNTASQASTSQALQWLRECLLSKDCYDECSHIANDQLGQELEDASSLRHDNFDLAPAENRDELEETTRNRRLQTELKILYERKQDNRGPLGVVGAEPAARLVEIIDCPDGDTTCNGGSVIWLKLVEGSSSRTPYVALSYRWGTLEAPWQTTTLNLASRQAGFLHDELPKTLCEAVAQVRKLGFSMIWIDSLCILQDDKDDWTREAVKMALIYQNALVTIAADSGDDTKAGLYNKTSSSVFNREDSFEIANTLSTGEESVIFLFHDAKTRLDRSITLLRNMGDLVSHCSLRDRGWTLQERVLSPRILHYASDQLYWECHHGIQESEDKLMWMGPGDYSHRSFSYSSDKILAIGGVGKAIDTIHPMEYLADHWLLEKNDLIQICIQLS